MNRSSAGPPFPPYCPQFHLVACLLTALVMATALCAGVALGEGESPSKLEEIRGLVTQGKYADAEAKARELLAELEARTGAESAEVGAVLDVLVESRWRGGKAQEPETRELAERALAVKEKIHGPQHADVAESLNNLAVIDFFVGEYLEARGLWERSLAIRKEALGPEHPDVAQLMNNLGNLLLRTGDFSAALPLYERALSIRLDVLGEEHPLVAQTLGNLAVLRVEMGDYAEALPLSERAVAMYKKLLPPGHPKIATSLNAYARVLLETGDDEGAIEVYKQVEAIWEDSLGPEHPSLGIAIGNRAEQLRKIGRLEESKSAYERSLAILEKAYGQEHPRVAGCLSGMGALAEASDDLKRAIELQERVVSIKEKTLGPEHARLALSLTDLGRLRLLVGEIEKALPLLERAVAIRRAALGSEHPVVAESLIALATAHAFKGDTGRAMTEALESEQIAREHLRLTGRSLSEQHTLRYASARERGLDLALSLAVADRLGASARRNVLDSLVRSRAVVLDGMAARHRSATMAKDSKVTRLAEELAAARSRLANMAVRGLGQLEPGMYKDLLDDAREKRERAERALAAASAEFAAELERGRLGLSEVGASLPAKAALVSFSKYRHSGIDRSAPTEDPVTSYVAFVLRSGKKEPVAVALGPAAELEALIAAWKAEAAGATLSRDPAEADTEYSRVGNDLRRRLWDPLARHLGDAQRVFIVPDGALNLVSLAALPAEQGGYLIEQGPLLQYLSAERDLVASGGDVQRGKGLLAIGAPDYGEVSRIASDSRESRSTSATRSACAGLESLSFEPLPGAAREVEQVVELWRHAGKADPSKTEEVIYLTSTKATESAFKAAVSGRRILHLATHGFFLGSDCGPTPTPSRGVGGMASAKRPDPTLQPEPREQPSSQPRPVLFTESPLLLSGLVLAGANQRVEAGDGEDGILTAEEIASLDLAGVELAVLSACDTGVGEIRTGEGVFGLRRALQIAGVGSLILSLWPIDDESTQLWMQELYRSLLTEGLDSAEATRAASMAVLQARREAGKSTHPFFWAAFVVTGDWRS